METERKKIFSKVIRKINNIITKTFGHGIIRNYFGKKNKKSVLISYITHPFLYEQKERVGHTNELEVKKIADIFNKMGYNVDVVDYRNRAAFKVQKYDVIFGLGYPFDFGVRNKRKGVCTIAYLTTSNPYFNNIEELKRNLEFERRSGMITPLKRQIDYGMDINLVHQTDFAICLGNEHTKLTWQQFYRRIFSINATGLDYIQLPQIHRDIKTAGKNFCFFSGSGYLHKGLDLCIEAIAELPECHLWIAGKIEQEIKEYYDKFKYKNIHFMGSLVVGSDDYKELCTRCLFSILPSCSEGQATSVLTTMFSGMIPIVSKECGIDVKEFGFRIEHNRVTEIRKIMREVSLMVPEKAEQREEAAYIEAYNNYTLDAYAENMEKVLEIIL